MQTEFFYKNEVKITLTCGLRSKITIKTRVSLKSLCKCTRYVQCSIKTTLYLTVVHMRADHLCATGSTSEFYHLRAVKTQSRSLWTRGSVWKQPWKIQYKVTISHKEAVWLTYKTNRSKFDAFSAFILMSNFLKDCRIFVF